MFCKKCGNELKENAKFCGKCGEPAPVVLQAEIPAAEPKQTLCQSCGNPLKDGAKFCNKCGATTNTAQKEVEQPMPAQIIDTNALAPSVMQLKKSMCSVLLIVAVVLYTILTLGRVVSAFKINTIDTDAVFSVIEDEDIDVDEYKESTEDAVGAMQSTKVVSNLLMATPVILITAGLIVNLIQARKKDKFETTGFKLVKSGVFVRLIFNALVFVFAVAMIAIIPNAIKEVFDELAKEADAKEIKNITDTITPIVTAVMGVVAVSQIVPLLHSVFAIFAASDIQKTIKTGEVTNKKYGGIRFINGLYVFFNAVKLVVVTALIIFADTLTEYINDAVELEGKAAREFEDLVETILAPNVWVAVSAVLVIATLVMFNKWMAKYAKDKIDAQTFAQ